MYRFYEPVIKPLLDALAPERVVEIGAAQGAHTRRLLGWCAGHDATLHVIDPVPDFDVEGLRELHGDQFVFHRARSLEALPLIGPSELVLIDGDHNWFTIFNELKVLETNARRARRPFPVVLLHDVAWPYGRRDLYYDPGSIPADERQPYCQMGVRPDTAELVEDGLNAHLNNAIYESDQRNGVLTAVEDFIERSRLTLDLETIPALHGLGILTARRARKTYPGLQPALDRLHTEEFLVELLGYLEQHRLQIAVTADSQRLKLAAAQEGAAAGATAASGLEAKLGELRERSEALEQQRKRAETERQQAVERLEGLERGVHAFDATRKDIESRLTSMLEAVAEARKATRSAEDTTADERRRADDAEGRAEAARARLAEVEAVLSASRAAVAAARGELETERERVEALTERGLELEEAVKAAATAERERARGAVKRLGEQLRQTLTAQAVLEDDLTAARAELARVSKQRDVFGQAVERTTRALDRTREDADRLRADLERSERERDDLRERNERRLIAERQGLSEQRRRFEADLRRIQREHEKALAALEAELGATRTDIARFEAALSGARGEIKAMALALEARDAEIAAYERRLVAGLDVAFEDHDAADEDKPSGGNGSRSRSDDPAHRPA